jgi:hypothetical protein
MRSQIELDWAGLDSMRGQVTSSPLTSDQPSINFKPGEERFERSIIMSSDIKLLDHENRLQSICWTFPFVSDATVSV